MENKIKISENKIIVNAVESELNLKVEEGQKVTLYSSTGNKEVVCGVIKKESFKNPAMTVEINGKTLGVEVRDANFGVKEFYIDKDGKQQENKAYKELKTVIEKFEKGQRINIAGGLALNEYPNKDFNWTSIQQVEGRFFSTSKAADEDSFDASLTGVVTGITDEVRNDEETGRKIVSFAAFGYGKDVPSAIPTKFVVEADLASDFEAYYEVGDSCKIYYEVVKKTVGKPVVESEGGFGRKAKLTSSYDVTEWVIVGGEAKYEEESEMYVDMNSDDFKAVVEARKVYIEKQIAKKKETAGNDGKKSDAALPFAPANSNPFGQPQTKVEQPKEEPAANPFGANPFM